MGTRRRHTLDILVAVAAVLLAAASIVTWGLPARDPWTHVPGEPPNLGNRSDQVSPCGWAWAPEPEAWVDLPSGARRMWICDGVVRRPVTRGVSYLIDQISAQPKADRSNPDCGPLADTGTVFVDYPDGTRVGFSWDTSCVNGGVAGRPEPRAAADAIRAAYQDQYGDVATPDADDDPNPCRPRQFTRIDAEIQALGSLTMCLGRLDPENGAGATTAVPLAPGDVVRALSGLRYPKDLKDRDSPPPPADAVLLRGVYPQGLGPSTATLWWSGDRIWISQGSDRVWQLSSLGRSVLERYRRGYVPDAPQVGPVAAAGDSPCGAEPQLSSPDTLPDRPVAAWLCTNDSRQIIVPSVADPLTLDPQALVDVYSALPLIDDDARVECDMTPGPSYNLVMRYRDRDVTIVGLLWACGQVGHRYGGYTMLQAFTNLLVQQRRSVPAPTVPTPTGPTTTEASPCQGWGSWIPGRVDKLTSMVSCDGDAVKAVLPASLIEDLRARSQLANDPIDPRPEPIIVAALAPDGTQIRIEWDGTSGWYNISGQWYRWRPSAEAEAALP